MTDTPANHPLDASPLDRQGALSLDDQVYAPLDEQMVVWLDIPPGARVLDAGCGRGAIAARLAEAVGPAGAVVAIDKAQEALAATGRFVAASPYGQLAASI